MSEISIRGGGPDSTAWIAISISITALFLTWYWNRRNERRSSRDSYWFREVLAPSCLDPVRNFRTQWTQQVLNHVGQNLTVAGVQALIAAAQSDLAVLRRDMWLAELFKGKFFQQATALLDQIEDAIASGFSTGLTKSLTANQSFSEDAARKMIDAITIPCLSVLQRAASMHDGNLKIRKPSWILEIPLIASLLKP